MKYILSSALIVFTSTVMAQSRSAFHLFNPTPAPLMRAFTTERPTKTASAFTVDAGHFQVESELMNFSEDEHNNQEDRLFKLLQTNVRLGLLNNLEVQVEVQPYIEQTLRTETPRQTTEQDGLGSTFLRMKYNLVGNDGGSFGVALMPGAKFPTAAEELRANERVEGQIIMPLSWQITSNWNLAGQLQVDNFNEDASLDWQTNYVTTISLSRKFLEDLTGYVEIYNQYVKNPETTNLTTLDFALQYQLNPMTLLDVGTYQGISPEATDEEYFVGASMRF